MWIHHGGFKPIISCPHFGGYVPYGPIDVLFPLVGCWVEGSPHSTTGPSISSKKDLTNPYDRNYWLLSHVNFLRFLGWSSKWDDPHEIPMRNQSIHWFKSRFTVLVWNNVPMCPVRWWNLHKSWFSHRFKPFSHIKSSWTIINNTFQSDDTIRYNHPPFDNSQFILDLSINHDYHD